MKTPIDGRTLRRTKNREAVIDALLELIREGNLQPGAAEIADRAGVSHRSFFRYFDDVSDLVQVAVKHEIDAATSLYSIPDTGEGTLEERVSRFVDSRIDLYERVRGVATVARIRSNSIPAFNTMLATVQVQFREQIREHFTEELSAWSQPDSEFVLDGCIILTSFASMDTHERVMSHDLEHIRRSSNTTLVALLTP